MAIDLLVSFSWVGLLVYNRVRGTFPCSRKNINETRYGRYLLVAGESETTTIQCQKSLIGWEEVLTTKVGLPKGLYLLGMTR